MDVYTRFANAVTIVFAIVGTVGAIVLVWASPGLPIRTENAGSWQAYAGLWSVVIAAFGFSAIVRYVLDTNRLANQGVQTLRATTRMELAKLNIEINRSLLDHPSVLESLAASPERTELAFTRPQHQMAGILLNYLEVVWHQSKLLENPGEEWNPWQKVLDELLQLPSVSLYWGIAKDSYSKSFKEHVDKLDR